MIHRCRKCGCEKVVAEFPKNKSLKRGFATQCKSCKNENSRRYYENDIDNQRNIKREAGRERRKVHVTTDSEREYIYQYMIKYKNTEKFKENRKKAARKYLDENREKTRAHSKVKRAVKSGVIVKGPCSVCGSIENIHGHHEDYNKPLDVIWLCMKHHKELHRKVRP